MLPNSININELFPTIEEEQDKTQTFGIDFTNSVVGSKIDGLAALRQSLYLMLSTEADQYIIYPYTYGIKTLDLIGQPNHYVLAVLPSRIKEALLTDDRVTDVTDFEFSMNRGKVNCRFVIHTIYGEEIDSVNRTFGNYIGELPPVDITLGEIEIALDAIIKLQKSYINGDNEQIGGEDNV